MGEDPEQLIEQIRAMGVTQVLLSTVSMVVTLSFGKIAAGELDEARLGIDALRALMPVLEGQMEEEIKKDLEQAVANLQLAYADAVRPR
ncbi:MAG TPA: hypothetical protein VG652_10545 [Gaiellaceae bacterium]|nr:hypothetical protein [Gaiellaceae bacterium]